MLQRAPVGVVRCELLHFSLFVPVVLPPPSVGMLPIASRNIDTWSSRVFRGVVPASAKGEALGGCPDDCNGNGICADGGRCICYATHTGYAC